MEQWTLGSMFEGQPKVLYVILLTDWFQTMVNYLCFRASKDRIWLNQEQMSD